MTSTLRVAGYIRVSNEEQTEGFSLDAQKRAIERWTRERGGVLVKIYADEGLSGRTINRTAFQQLRRDASNHNFDAVVVHKWDRFGRSRMDSLVIKSLLRKEYGVKVYSVTEMSQDDEESGAIGMLMEGVSELIAEWYSVNLGTEVSKAHAEKHQQGYHITRPPFGYDKDGKELVKNPQEVPGVVLTFQLYATGKYSYEDVASALNKAGYRAKTGRPFAKDTVRVILSNKIYVGYVSYHKMRQNSKGKRDYVTPTQWLPGKHEPIISDELFQQVEKIQQNRKRLSGHKHYRPHLLRGLVYCQHCLDTTPPNPPPSWARMYARHYDDYHGQCYYICDRKRRGYGKCKQLFAGAEVIEGQVLQMLMSLKPGKDWRDRAIEALASSIGERNVQKRLDELKVIASRMDNRFDMGLFVDTDDYLKERRHVQDEIDALAPLLSVSQELEQAADILNNFEYHWGLCGGDIEAQHQLLTLVLKKVFVSEGEVLGIMLTPDYNFVFRPPYTRVAPAGFEDTSSASIEKAVRRVLGLLYAGMELPSEPLTDYKPPKENRNREIYRRYVEGARAVDLAAEYGISLQRVYVIIRVGKQNQW